MTDSARSPLHPRPHVIASATGSTAPPPPGGTIRLESLHNIARLREIAAEERPPGMTTVWTDAVDDLITGRSAATVSGVDLVSLRSDCDVLREIVNRRGETALGAIDTTPGSERVGLAAAWTVAVSEQVVARNSHVTVIVSATDGLVVDIDTTTPGGADRLTVEEVAVHDDGRVDLVGSAASHTLPAEASAPLTWLVPGARNYRIRHVPEVIVWAPTFTQLPELCLDAVGAGFDITLALDTSKPAPDTGSEKI